MTKRGGILLATAAAVITVAAAAILMLGDDGTDQTRVQDHRSEARRQPQNGAGVGRPGLTRVGQGQRVPARKKRTRWPPCYLMRGEKWGSDSSMKPPACRTKWLSYGCYRPSP